MNGRLIFVGNYIWHCFVYFYHRLLFAQPHSVPQNATFKRQDIKTVMGRSHRSRQKNAHAPILYTIRHDIFYNPRREIVLDSTALQQHVNIKQSELCTKYSWIWSECHSQLCRHLMIKNNWANWYYYMMIMLRGTWWRVIRFYSNPSHSCWDLFLSSGLTAIHRDMWLKRKSHTEMQKKNLFTIRN